MSRQIETLRAFTAGRPHNWRHAPHVIVVASGKGGVGVSTVSALLAVGSARRGRDTLIVDAAMSGSPIIDLFDRSAAELVDSDRAAGDRIHTIAPRLALADRMAVEDPTSLERRSTLRRLATRYDSHETVIVDAGSTAESVTTAIGAGAGMLLTVCATDRLSVAATYALVKYVSQRFEGLPVSVLVNRSEPAESRIAFARIAAGATEFLRQQVTPAGQFPDDHGLGSAIEAGLSPVNSDGPALDAACLLAELLISRRPGKASNAPLRIT